ncbi:hypothetical protein [Flavobacterium sp.]|uniref:hypothetical protein n=1 Tax=Flavobacterium sp. TaxID=239 RepID=UPI00260C329C|nr:hypothetical protein [Flavobacterium sp.]
MKKNKTFKIITLFFLLITFSGCDSIIDCIAGIRPELVAKDLNVGINHHSYTETVTFEMLHDDTTDYYISDVLIKGNLPPNINYSTSGQVLTFNGVPNVTGTYEFTVEITVKPYTYNEDGGDNLCSSTATKNYKITII